MTVWGPDDFDDPNMPDEVREIFERLNRPFGKAKNNAVLPPLKVPPPLPIGSAKLYTMKIALLDVEPPIWRRFVAPSFMTLNHFHVLLQTIMGWNSTHMYAFTINDNRFTGSSHELSFAVDSMWDTEPSYNAANYELCQLIKSGMTIRYEYDFGDGWEHEIIVENDTVSHDTKHCFYCIEGERACPPEDCGGPGGYESLLEILADPEHPEHEEKVEWLEFIGHRDGKFDSERFDPEVCNRTLKVRKPSSSPDQRPNKTAWSKKKKQERKRKEAAKKRNRK